MRAVVFHGVGDIRLDAVPEPKIEQPTDAIVRITTAAICGTDLHFVRGTVPNMIPGTVIGHEGVGVVEEVGRDVRNFKRGDRVLLSAVLGCGSCSYCRTGYFAQCDDINPRGPRSGSAFYGASAETGPFNGLQAEYARVPYAHTNLIGLPDSISDDQAIPLSDIYPTGYFGAVIAEVSDGDVVAVWGCGPVGQFAILSSFQRGAEIRPRRRRTLGIIGVYPPTDRFFPIGTAMNKNLTIKMGNGNHPRYIPKLLAMVESGVVDPETVVTQHEPLRDVIAAYEQFDLRSPGWLKVALDPAA